ncbi:MAG: chorismate-binding protein [Bacteroidota bacterium]
MNEVTNSPSFKKLKPAEITTLFLDAAYTTGLPIACWKLPHSNHFNVAVSFNSNVQIVKPEIESLPAGFIVAPFSLRKQLSFIRADLFYQSSEIFPKESFKVGVYGSEESMNSKRFWKAFELATTKLEQGYIPQYHAIETRETNTDKKTFLRLVEKGIKSIKSGAYQKIVYSRSKTANKPNNFHATKVFISLCQDFPSAFVSLVSLPEEGTWLGASPETLVEIDSQKIFKTVALAGTQKKAKFKHLSDATWRQKEIEEQALVSRYIINCFKKIRLREFEELGPKTVAAGSLIHLKTDFVVNINEVNFPQLGSVMLELLHPTSAVCGMPQAVTMQDILTKEGYDRRLYSGYLGPVNVDNNTHIFVNLRCMQVGKKQLVFYAGAGITEDSVPKKEFLETEMKMDVLRKRILAKITK